MDQHEPPDPTDNEQSGEPPSESPPPPPVPPEFDLPSRPLSTQGSDPDAEAPNPEETAAFVLPESLAFLRNRLVLSGISLIVVLLLVLLVLFSFRGSDDFQTPTLADASLTPELDGTAEPTNVFLGRVLTTATMRNGPGAEFAIIGTVPSGALVPVVGRNDDETWLQIVPPNSQLRAWVEASSLNVSGQISDLAIAGPGSSPSVSLPTQPRPVLQPTRPPQPPAPPTDVPPPTSPLAPTSTPPPTATEPPPPPTDPPPAPSATPPGRSE